MSRERRQMRVGGSAKAGCGCLRNEDKGRGRRGMAKVAAGAVANSDDGKAAKLKFSKTHNGTEQRKQPSKRYWGAGLCGGVRQSGRRGIA